MNTKPITNCEELERAAIAAAEEREKQWEKERIARQSIQYEEAYAQLKEKIPLLEKSGDGETFVLCERKMRYEYTGMIPAFDGSISYSYSLVPLVYKCFAYINDLASLGAWLKAEKEEEERRAKHPKPSFWKRILSIS